MSEEQCSSFGLLDRLRAVLESTCAGKRSPNVGTLITGHLGIVFEPEEESLFKLVTEWLPDMGIRARLEALHPPRNGATRNLEQINAFDSRCDHRYPSCRSGIFASLLGTLTLLQPEDRARVKGLVVNKFRDDLSLWRPGEQLLTDRSGVPVLGTVPFFNDIHIAEEDSVALEDGTAFVLQHQQNQAKRLLEVVVVRLPYLSNYDEFDALAAEPMVRLRFAASPADFPAEPDLIILPGTKNTFSDLAWLWRQGLAQHIRQCAKHGCAVLGICGGYQMLGERLSDIAGAEADAGTVEPGLNLLPVETFFEPINEKITQRNEAQIDTPAIRGLFANMNRQRFQVYQIHIGRTVTTEMKSQGGTYAFQTNSTGKDGWLSPDGWCAGCYLHGLFENDNYRQSIIATLSGRSTAKPVMPERVSFTRQAEYDKLASLLRKHIDIPRLKALCRLTD